MQIIHTYSKRQFPQKLSFTWHKVHRIYLKGQFSVSCKKMFAPCSKVPFQSYQHCNLMKKIINSLLKRPVHNYTGDTKKGTISNIMSAKIRRTLRPLEFDQFKNISQRIKYPNCEIFSNQNLYPAR